MVMKTVMDHAATGFTDSLFGSARDHSGHGARAAAPQRDRSCSRNRTGYERWCRRAMAAPLRWVGLD